MEETMIEFLVKKTYKFRKDLEDEDFRHFAHQLACKWADYYTASDGGIIAPDNMKYWLLLQEAIGSARFWNIINAEFAHDLSAWLKESEFVSHVPSSVANEYQARFSVDPKQFRLMPKFLPKRYSLEQYFVYKEVCKAFGVAPYSQDVK